MTEVKVNFSIPVTLSDYKSSENTLYSYAKLKIFYVGMTGDKRLFTKEFSDNLLKTLPYVPVVGYYDKEEEDFKGHHSTQYIYGLVPESTEIEYITEDDKEYAVCDVILYTGRNDETGKIAQQIVGKQHSLELNPADTKYVINKSADGTLKNIEFKSGSLIGLSVLGDGEKPAFTGSGFFSSDKNLEEIFKGFKEQIEKFTDYLNKQRGENMKELIFATALEYIKKSYKETIDALFESLKVVYNYFYIEEVFNDYVVIKYFDDLGERTQFIKIPYEMKGDIVELGVGFEVFPRYLTAEEIQKWEEDVNNATEDSFSSTVMTNEGEVAPQEESTQVNENTESLSVNPDEVPDDITVDSTHIAEASVETSVILNTEEQELELGENGVAHEEENTGQNSQNEATNQEFSEDPKSNSSTALTNSEREELNAFRREKKYGLIESFNEDLDREFLEKISKEIDTHSFDELEVILSKEFTRVSKERSNKKPSNFSPFSYRLDPKTSGDKVKDLIDIYKDKNK